MKLKRVVELVLIYPVAGILILAGIGIVFPVFPHRCGSIRAHQTAAVATLRNICSAQMQFRDAGAVDLDGDGESEFGTFRELSRAWYLRGLSELGDLDPPMLSGAFRNVRARGEVHRSRYLFRVFLSGTDGAPICPDALETGYGGISIDLAERHWCAYAWPAAGNDKDRRVFFVNEDGVVLYARVDANLGPDGPPSGSAFLGGGKDLTGEIALGVADGHGLVWSAVK